MYNVVITQLLNVKLIKQVYVCVYIYNLMWRVDSLEKIDSWGDWGQEKKGTTEDEMAGWHHRLDAHEFE